jgi:hypothetical protein
MTAVPSLLTWDCVGYCAKAAVAAAKQTTSSPKLKRILKDRATFLWLLDIVNGSFLIYLRIEQLGK